MIGGEPQGHDWGGLLLTGSNSQGLVCVPPSPRTNSSHTMKTGVLILLVSLLCAEKGEMEKRLRVEGTLAFSLCAQCLRCTGVMGVPCVGWLVVGELSCAWGSFLGP